MDAAIREENGALVAALAGDMDLEDYGKARAPSRDRVARRDCGAGFASRQTRQNAVYS